MLMSGLVFLVLAVLALTLLAARMRSRDAAQMLRWALGLGGMALGVLLTVRGLAVAGLPLIGAAVGLLGVAMRGGKRKSAGSTDAPPPTRSAGSMSRKEALDILGVDENASDDEIHSAYRAMMKRVHPDAGGSDALAAKVHEARNVLLERRS